MPDSVDQHAAPSIVFAERDPKVQQRLALQQVLDLSIEPVQEAESHLERGFDKAKATLEKRHHERTEKLETRFQTLIEDTRRQHQELVAKVENCFQSDSTRLETNTRSAREQISGETENTERQAKKALEQDIWLAESVAEATREKLARRLKKLNEEAPGLIKQVDDLDERAQWVLHEYRATPPLGTPPTQPDPGPMEDPSAVFRERCESADQSLDTLQLLKVPRLFIGLLPYSLVAVAALSLVGIMGAMPSLLTLPGWWPPFYVTGPAAAVVAIVTGVLVGKALRRVARRQVTDLYLPISEALGVARVALQRKHELAVEQIRRQQQEAVRLRDAEIQKARDEYETIASESRQRRDTTLQRLDETYAAFRREIDERRGRDMRQVMALQEERLPALERQYDRCMELARTRYARHLQECHARRKASRAELEEQWKEGLARIATFLDAAERLRQAFPEWEDPSWQTWKPPRQSAPVVRFGTLRLDMDRLAPSVRALAPFEADPGRHASIPALLTFPDQCSLLMQTERSGREESIRVLQAIMARLVTALRPGNVRFTIVDPVGLGENFAGFMHLADYQEELVGGRIWTDAAHIEQRLSDLTVHMENVIQKYLRNEFETIEAYNIQAGELAEPYRFLVIANFPANFTEEAVRRLASIVNSGQRCGVYTLIAYDARQPLPPGVAMEDITARSVHLIHQGERFVWQDDIFRRFPLTLDEPPAEEMLTRLMHQVGHAARDSNRVEVPFSVITPADDERWKSDSSLDLRVPIGRTGAVRLQHLRLGRGVAQHALIAGKTGSGKSTLLHVMVTNLMLWYSPDEVEFYLIDFKQGVEFKTYAMHDLPHARAIAIESDREFGLSVLQRLDREMERRGELFRRAGVQDLAGYREATGRRMPRTLLIVDEFQVFFSEDDKLGQDAAVLLDRIVRQGRAFGVHALLGSQTLGGTAGLARSTIGQMAVRIALQCSESDSQLILDDDNTAARLLSRPGEAIYNDAGGLVQGNSPFQTAWLSDETRDGYLEQVEEMGSTIANEREPVIVFEGNAPADIRKNRELESAIEATEWPASTAARLAWLGEPVAIKEPTAITFRRQSGANVLMIGQRDDAALSLMTAAIVSLGAQHHPRSARFVILDGTPPDVPRAGELPRVVAMLPHVSRVVEWRDVADAINEIAIELRRRQGGDTTDAPAIYLFVYGLQRYRMLRRQEDSFSFSRDDADKPPPVDKQFAEMLREGPPLGIHSLIWCDTQASIERTLDRQAVREFDHRILFQMSAADSSNLIDSPEANRLGFYRAMLYSEEQGLLEKFRPYAALDRAWLEQVRERLLGRGAPQIAPDNVP